MQPPDCMKRTQSSSWLSAPMGPHGEPLLEPPLEPEPEPAREPEPNRSDLPCRSSMNFIDLSSALAVAAEIFSLVSSPYILAWASSIATSLALSSYFCWRAR